MYGLEMLSSGYKVNPTPHPLTKQVASTNCLKTLFCLRDTVALSTAEILQLPVQLASEGKLVAVYLKGTRGDKDHYFFLFKDDNSHDYFLIQSFQNIYTLQEWLTHQGNHPVTGNYVSTNLNDIFTAANNNDRLTALGNLFKPKGFKDDKHDAFNAWWAQNEVNGLVSLRIQILDLPIRLNGATDFPDLK